MLYQAIGSFVITAGHVEWAMCRVIGWVHGAFPGDVPEKVARLGWSSLIKTIDYLALTNADARIVSDLLRKHDIERLTGIRHNMVHGRVSVDRAPAFHAVRHYPTGRKAIIVGNTDDVLRSVQEMRALAHAIELALPEDRQRVRYPDED